MQLRVGIPRALSYHEFFPAFEEFFRALGCEVVVTASTTASIAQQGIALACDEVCYPVKVMHGHVAALAGQVDKIFVPRLFSTESGTCECPKLIGLADMLRHSISDMPPLISPYVNMRLGRRGLRRAVWAGAKEITLNPWRISFACRQAHNAWMERRRTWLEGQLSIADKSTNVISLEKPSGNIAVVGHPYNLYDSYLNLRLFEHLHIRGYRVYTPQMLSGRDLVQANLQLRKPLFWSAGRKVFGAGAHYAAASDIDGIIHVASFGCGLESLLIDLVQRMARLHNKPFLLLTMDEHTGEAGVETRLEAFLDMLLWREEAGCV